MNQVSFDTHAAMRRLGQAGASTPLAEAVVDIVTEATSLNMRIVEDLAYLKSQIETNMATKADIAALRGDSATLRADTKADIAALRGDSATLRADTKADIAALRGDSATLRADTKADIAALRGAQPCAPTPRPISQPCEATPQPCAPTPRLTSQPCAPTCSARYGFKAGCWPG